MPDLFAKRIWREGCSYIVAEEGDLCLKCCCHHKQTAQEAKQWPFQDGDGDAD